MATLQFTATAQEFSDLTDAICDQYGYQAVLSPAFSETPGPNPESKSQFAKRMIIQSWKNQVKDHKRKVAFLATEETFTNSFTPPAIT